MLHEANYQPAHRTPAAKKAMPEQKPKHDQAAFTQAVLNPDLPVPDGIVRANGGDPREAFNVYGNNVVASLAQTLKAAFPVTSHLLGEGLQRALMADFARAHPPQNAVMATYGGALPDFLAQHPATKAKPFLADVALSERRRIEAYHAADAPVFDGATLAQIDPDDLTASTLLVHPAVRLVASRFPIATIHAIEKAAMDGTLAEGARVGVNLRKGEAVLIARPRYEVTQQSIGKGDLAFVQACADGLPFGVAAAAGFDADPTYDFQASLSLCFAAGVFTSLQPSPALENFHGQP